MKTTYINNFKYEGKTDSGGGLGGWIGGAITAAGSALSSISVGRMNKKQRKWATEQYDKERTNAVADWNMQNSYNAPQAQMQRYRDAGLNPNLIYGQSNEGAVVRSATTQTPQQNAPDYGAPLKQGLSTYFETQMKEATINNLKAQNDNIIAQKNLIEAQTQGVYKNMQNQDSQMGLRDWDLNNRKSLAPYNLEIKDWNVRHLMKDMDIKTQNHEYGLMKKSQDIEKGGIDIINARIDTSLKHLQERYMEGSINKQTYETELTKTKMLGEVIQQKYIQALKENVEGRTHFQGSENNMKVIQTALGAINALFGSYRVTK